LRQIGRHGTTRVAKAVLVGAVTPLKLKTTANPGGPAMKVQGRGRDRVPEERRRARGQGGHVARARSPSQPGREQT
jgi:hypothetical protein